MRYLPMLLAAAVLPALPQDQAVLNSPPGQPNGLIVWGKYDELANPAGADRLEKAIPGARKVIIDNCGHMPQLERADEFNRLVRDFLLTARGTNQ